MIQSKEHPWLNRGIALFMLLILTAVYVRAQQVSGRILDALTREPLQGATIETGGKTFTSAADGSFLCPVTRQELTVSFTGYITKKVRLTDGSRDIEIQPSPSSLSTVVLTANRTAQKRSEAPVAIGVVSRQVIEDTRATRFDQLLNKVSGVNAVSLGNEQHQMSIRQPMTTKSLFLYLEDGIPIRTTGLYNHNALLEMNLAATRQIEVVKGPASSLYGAEAIGGAVNIITQGPPAYLNGRAAVQLSNTGYRRTDLQVGNTHGKFGWLVSGYYAIRRNGPVAHSDFDKGALSFRGDYTFSERTKWVNSITYINYYSDMFGALDSLHFANRDYTTPQTFTYRKVPALRVKSQLLHQWNERASSQLALIFRDNAIAQNPSYRVKNVTGDPTLAHGEINESAFNTYMALAQHQQRFSFLNSKLVAGLSVDGSPSDYNSRYIRIHRDERGYYTRYDATDSVLSRYSTRISNIASYLHAEAVPLKGLRLTAALRYDLYHYNFINSLPPSAFTGAPSSRQHFNRLSPKLGLTYNYRGVGWYGNISEGFVPPQISELFTGTKVPYLDSQTFLNYEIGGWLSLAGNKLYADWSAYLLNGTNEIISVRNADGSLENQNAGKTKHTGIEYGINYRPSTCFSLRFSGANNRHSFVDYVEKGVAYDGNELAGGPRFIGNAELTYRPGFVKGLRIGAEWQHIGPYFMDNANTEKYNGYNVLNLRIGYNFKNFECWLNTLNITDVYYATNASKAGFGYSYNVGDPREFNIGVAYRFSRQ